MVVRLFGDLKRLLRVQIAGKGIGAIMMATTVSAGKSIYAISVQPTLITIINMVVVEIKPCPVVQYSNEKKDDWLLTIVSPPYFKDDEECGYCQREIGEPHKAWCRQ